MKIIGIKKDKLLFEVTEQVESIIKNIGRLETNNKYINNTKGSSAKGKYQIIDSTFKRIVKYYQDIIDESKFSKHTAENDDSIMLLLLNYYREKIKVGNLDFGTCYLAHFLGAERANKFAKDQSLVISDFMTDNELKWNADVFKRFGLNINCTAKEFIDKINELEV